MEKLALYADMQPLVDEMVRALQLLSNRDAKEAGWLAKKQEGLEQVQGYLQLPEVAQLRDLAAWVLVTDGESVEVLRVQ